MPPVCGGHIREGRGCHVGGLHGGQGPGDNQRQRQDEGQDRNGLLIDNFHLFTLLL